MLSPRLLSREQAARYLGLSPNQFEIEVAAGTWPAAVPLRRTRRKLWDRVELDRALDSRLTVSVDPGGWDERRERWRANQDRPPAPR